MGWKQHFKSGLDHWIQLSSNEEKYISIKKQLMELRDDIDDELTIMIAGEFNAGKSTFINALLGSKILSSDVTPETAMVTKLTYGSKKKVIANYLDGKSEVYDDAWLEQLTAERNGHFKTIRHQLSYVEIQIPIEILKTFTIIDTPGLNANNQFHTSATERFLGRTDFAFFLFHSMNVGTATEIKWLKKFNGQGIYPFGIINRIDELDEEEDDLEELIDFNKPRLGPAIQELFGVSARDALTGKLQKKHQLLEWSNWEEVEKLLEKCKEQTYWKMERAYSRILEPIRQMDKLCLDWKLSLPLKKLNSQKVEQFVSKGFPELLSTKERLENQKKMAIETNEKWNVFLKPPIYTMDGFDKFLKQFMEQARNMELKGVSQLKDNPLQEWEERIFPQYHSFDKGRTEYMLKVNEMNEERKELDQSWKDLYYRNSLGKMRKLEKHRMNLEVFHHQLEELNKQRQKLVSQFNEIVKNVNGINDSIKTFIKNDIQFYIDKERKEIKNWNSQLEKERKSFGDFSRRDSAYIHLFAAWMKDFQENVIQKILRAGKTTENFLAYEEASYLFGNIANLKQGLPREEFYSNFKMMESFSTGKEIQYQWDFPRVTPPELHRHNLQSIPQKLDHDIQSELNEFIMKRYNWIFAIIIAVVLSFVITLVIIDSINKDKEYKAISVDEEITSDSYEDEVDVEQQRLEEEKRLLEAQFPESKIEEFLESMHEQLRYDRSSYDKMFTEYGWDSYWPFYLNLAEEELVNLDVYDVDYGSENEILAKTKEIFVKDGVQKEYETRYFLTPDSYSSEELMITSVSLNLTKEKETEIVISDDQISDFLRNFRTTYLRALNATDPSYIVQFFEEQSTARDQLTTFIESIVGKNYLYEEMLFQIDTISKIGINEYSIITQERFMLTDDKEEKSRNERNKEYIVKVFPENGPVIMKITTTHSNKEVIVEPTTVQLVSNQSVNNFIHHYYDAFVDAFNGYGFSYVQNYYDPNGSSYADTEAYILNANNENMHMTNLEFNVESIVEADDNHYWVTVYLRDEYSYQNVSGDRKKILAKYKVRVTRDGDMMITENPPVEILEKIVLQGVGS